MTVNFESDPTSLALSATDDSSIAAWRHEMERAFPPLDIVPFDSSPFFGNYRAAGTRDLQISDIQASPHIVQRQPGAVSSKNFEYYKVSFQVAGHGVMVQGDRTLELAPGRIAIYDTSRPYDVVFDEDFRFIVAMFPKAALELPPGLPEELLAYPIDGTIGAGSIAGAYLMSMAENLELLRGDRGERLARTGLDLITMLVSEALDMTTPRSALEERRTTLLKICHYINENLTDPTLSPDTIAAAHFISTRHLYNHFDDAGVSVAQWVRHRRLVESRYDLIDPLYRHKSIAQIAEKWSFEDAGHFSRVFKQNLGITPTECRQRAFPTTA